MTDHWLGKFLEAFREKKLHENTVILLLSDHGYLLGERGVTGKVPSQLHPELAQVPFIVAHPDGRAAGEASSHFASTHDVGPTLLSLVGRGPPELDGGPRPLPPHGRRAALGPRGRSTTAACTTASSSAPTSGS